MEDHVPERLPSGAHVLQKPSRARGLLRRVRERIDG